MNKNRKDLALILLVCLGYTLSFPLKANSSLTTNQVVKIAFGTMNAPLFTYHYYKELIDFMGERMNLEVNLVRKKKYLEIDEMLKQGEIDLAFISSGAYAWSGQDYQMELLAIPAFHGQKEHHAYLIVNQDSTLQSFDQLKGKTFALSCPFSDAGFILPLFILAEGQQTKEDFFKDTFFSYGAENCIKSVAEGLADGAMVDSFYWELLALINPKLTSSTRVIEKRHMAGSPPVLVRSSMETETKDRLRQFFLTLDQDQAGKKILSRMKIERFIPAYVHEYEPTRQMIKKLKLLNRLP